MKKVVPTKPFLGRQAATRLALVATVAVGSGACNRLDDYAAAELGNPDKRHAIGFTSSPEALYVEIAPGGGPLSANQETDVLRFVQRYKSESTGTLRIAAPKSAGEHLATSQSLRQIEQIVRNAGIDPSAIEASRYEGSKRIGPALKLSYDRTDAVPPACGDWATDLGENRERLPYNDYGCATRRNLALTVANGRDLQGPQEQTPRSSERRTTVWRDYVISKPGAAKTEGSGEGAGAISGAVGQ